MLLNFRAKIERGLTFSGSRENGEKVFSFLEPRRGERNVQRFIPERQAQQFRNKVKCPLSAWSLLRAAKS